MADPQVAGNAPRSDYCIFLRDGQRFALSTAIAKEVLEARPFTPVPYAPSDLLGAFNLRGEVVPLVNLDRLLQVDTRPVQRGDTLLILAHRDLALAAVVDQVVVIKHVSPWEIRRAKLDPTVQNPLVRGLVGAEGEQAMVLDGERLLAVVVEQIVAGMRGGKTRAHALPAVAATASGEATVAAATSGDGGQSSPQDPAGSIAPGLPGGGR